MSNEIKKTKRTFWTISLFYFLIAFEFFYMASPFALYFYGAYKPGLNFLNEIPYLSWLASFFMPHVVLETKSTLINTHNVLGASIAGLGLFFFCYGAVQIYYSKLVKKGAVLGGMYKFIRHPQYTSFIVCSFGLLLLWPRFLVLIMFITILFAYYFLAKVEEKECEEKFGESYREYKKSTNMFLPFRISSAQKFKNNLQNRIGKPLTYILIYLCLLSCSLGIARVIQNYSINNLYTLAKDSSIFLSITEITNDKFEKLIEIAVTDSLVKEKVEAASSKSERLLNYVLPADIYISEIPMNYDSVDIYAGRNHFINSTDDEIEEYKIIFTNAVSPSKMQTELISLFRNPTLLKPLVEVWIDLKAEKIIKIIPPASVRYENIPVPIF